MGGAALWLVLALAGAVLGAGGEGRSLLGAPAAFELESTLQLNDAARADREVGYKLRARLAVVPRWVGDQDDYLLEFQLWSPKLYMRGKHVNADFVPYESVWDSYSDSTFFAHWSRGEIKAAYLDPSELPDVLNYKKSLLSLFQVQMLDGEYNETDVSGPCQVLYETISTDVFRKIKRSCAEGAGVVHSARRVARYSLGAAGLRALHAEELLVLGHAALGLKARSWHTLQRADAPPRQAARAASLQDALQALPRALRALPLTLQAAPGEDAADDEELSALLPDAGSGEGGSAHAALAGAGPGEGGSARAAAAALQLLPALRRANHSAALQLLQRADLHDHLSGLCRLLGLAGTRAAHAAADDFLQLHAHDPLAGLAQAYLAGFALADRPDEAVVLDVLRLARGGAGADARGAALAAAPPAGRAARLGRARARRHVVGAGARAGLGGGRLARGAGVAAGGARRPAAARPGATGGARRTRRHFRRARRRSVDTRSRGFRRRRRGRGRRARRARAARRGAGRRARARRGRRAPGRHPAVRRTGGAAGPRVGGHGQHAHARAARAATAAARARRRAAAGRRARARAPAGGAGAGAGRAGAGVVVVAQRARRAAAARRPGGAGRAAAAHGVGRAERGRRRARRAAPAHRVGPGLLLGRGAVRAREHGGALAGALGDAGLARAAPARAARARVARGHAGPLAGAGPAQRRHVLHAARGRRRRRCCRGRRGRTVTRSALRSHQRLARFCSELSH